MQNWHVKRSEGYCPTASATNRLITAFKVGIKLIMLKPLQRKGDRKLFENL